MSSNEADDILRNLLSEIKLGNSTKLDVWEPEAAIIYKNKEKFQVMDAKLDDYNGRWLRVPEKKNVQPDTALNIIAMTDTKQDRRSLGCRISFLYETDNKDMDTDKNSRDDACLLLIPERKKALYGTCYDKLNVNDDKNISYVAGAFGDGFIFTKFVSSNGDTYQFCLRFRGTIKDKNIEYLVEMFTDAKGDFKIKFIYRKDIIRDIIPPFTPIENGTYLIQNVFSGLYVAVHPKLLILNQQKKNSSNAYQKFKITCANPGNNSETTTYTIKSMAIDTDWEVDPSETASNGTRLLVGKIEQKFKIIEHGLVQGRKEYCIKTLQNDRCVEVTTNRSEEMLQIWDIIEDRRLKQSFRLEKVEEAKNKNNNN